MQAQIRNYRGTAAADIEIAKVVLISGENAQGKSSTLAGIAAAATGLAIPQGFTKGNAARLIREGADEGFIALKSDAGRRSIAFPSAECTGAGTPPFASVYAAGLFSILDFDSKDRAKALIELLKAEPSRDDLSKAFAEAGIGSDDDTSILDQVWTKIEAVGWDGAHKAATDRGAKLKGAWEEVTGKKYGSKVAEGWTPDGWLPEYGTESTEALTDRLATAKAALETAISNAAVDQAEHARRTEGASRVGDLQVILASAEAELATAKAALETAEKHLATLPTGAGYLGIPCPHCGEKVVTHRSASGAVELHKAQPDISDTDKKKQRLAIADAEGAVSRLKGDVGTKQAEFGRVKGALATAQDDAQWLVDHPIKEGAGADVPAARQAVADAEQLINLIAKRNRAASRHAEVAENQIMIDLLAPQGLRQKKLVAVIEAFNGSRLHPLCEAADWKAVSVEQDLSVTYGGRPYALLSASEQWRVRAIVQIATAQIDGSELILIDAADILSGRGRNGLMALLAGLPIPVVVAMTYGVPDKVPNLAAAGIGSSYWIADGVAVPLETVTMKKAA